MAQPTRTNPQDAVSHQKRLKGLIQKPKKAEKRPSDFALWWAWGFFNLVAFLFDLIAASTVFAMTSNNWLYAILTFFAGFLPLMMHEFGFIRASANKRQKITAVLGAGIAVLSIIAVGVMAAIVNVTGLASVSSSAMELTIMIVLIFVSVTHGILAAVYFYTDSGIQRNHNRAETMAMAFDQIDEMKMAGGILQSLKQALKIEDELNELYESPDALTEIRGQLSGNDLFATDEEEVPARAPVAASTALVPLASTTATPMPQLAPTPGAGGLWEKATNWINSNNGNAQVPVSGVEETNFLADVPAAATEAYTVYFRTNSPYKVVSIKTDGTDFKVAHPIEDLRFVTANPLAREIVWEIKDKLTPRGYGKGKLPQGYRVSEGNEPDRFLEITDWEVVSLQPGGRLNPSVAGVLN